MKEKAASVPHHDRSPILFDHPKVLDIRYDVSEVLVGSAQTSLPCMVKHI
jgi:hypothetical protein